jgi:hypothetical protein
MSSLSAEGNQRRHRAAIIGMPRQIVSENGCGFVVASG